METMKSNTEENKLCPCLFASIMVFLFAEKCCHFCLWYKIPNIPLKAKLLCAQGTCFMVSLLWKMLL